MHGIRESISTFGYLDGDPDARRALLAVLVAALRSFREP